MNETVIQNYLYRFTTISICPVCGDAMAKPSLCILESWQTRRFCIKMSWHVFYPLSLLAEVYDIRGGALGKTCYIGIHNCRKTHRLASEDIHGTMNYQQLACLSLRKKIMAGDQFGSFHQMQFLEAFIYLLDRVAYDTLKAHMRSLLIYQIFSS